LAILRMGESPICEGGPTPVLPKLGANLGADADVGNEASAMKLGD